MKKLALVLLLCAAAVLWAVAPAAHAATRHARTPAGVPGRWHLIYAANGKQMAAWQHTLFGDQCTDAGGITTTPGGELALTTSGEPGNCAEIASRKTFAPTARHPIVIQARIKFPVTSGAIPNWPAFWVSVPSWKVWPLDGEIDIAEGLAGNSTWAGGVCATYHYSTNGIPPGATAPMPQPGVGNTASTCAAPQAGWHTYSVLWKPRSLSFYYDGKRLVTYTGRHILAKPLSVIYDNTTGWPGGQGQSTVLVAETTVYRAAS